MKTRIIELKNSYENRSTRERFFLLGLSFAIIYTLFYFVLFRATDKHQEALAEQIQFVESHNNQWQLQIDNLNKIAQSPMYKQWLEQKKTSSHLRGKYQNLLQTFSLHQWQDIIKTVIKPFDNVRIGQIKNLPETALPSIVSDNQKNIYERRLALVIYSHFFSTIKYMDSLEDAFPNIHWESLDYHVIQYPAAKVEMELSVYYEKK